jgi:hypothetical protein
MKKLILAFTAVVAIGTSNAKAANLLDDDYTDDYAYYKTGDLYTDYMELYRREGLAGYCGNVLKAKLDEGPFAPGYYWRLVSDAAAEVEGASYDDISMMREEGLSKRMAEYDQYSREPAYTKFKLCPTVKRGVNK